MRSLAISDNISHIKLLSVGSAAGGSGASLTPRSLASCPCAFPPKSPSSGGNDMQVANCIAPSSMKLLIRKSCVCGHIMRSTPSKDRSATDTGGGGEASAIPSDAVAAPVAAVAAAMGSAAATPAATAECAGVTAAAAAVAAA
eukprot:CAMPEP_0170305712 /NCGR_PEP_ID=MMETSP0116_2-20130129/53231_1 /TAXON_ID=400756 /ORGANISM="Durinskia baltica, Strain CSIRO CS-38" /LENGTH=142 /DNA_ID=CAMNT_0010557765 /DNA_START=292 /DNA_END=717 /DNA_ORIENTATION=+